MSKASKTRAYNKAFDEREVLQSIGITNCSADGLWTTDKGEAISAYPGRPGKVTLYVTAIGRGQRRCTFGRGQIDDMRAFANGERTAAEKRALVTKAAPELLAALIDLVTVSRDTNDRTSDEAADLEARYGSPNGTWTDTVDAVKQRARKAIALARGTAKEFAR